MQLPGQMVKPFKKPRQVQGVGHDMSPAEMFRFQRCSSNVGQMITEMYWGTSDDSSNNDQTSIK